MAGSTRLRFLRSKDIELLMGKVQSLPFKIEIKGNPMKTNGKWYIFFVLPEESNPSVDKFVGGDIDGS